MSEILLFLLAIVGVFLAACSIALIALGKMIDRCPAAENEETRERSIASPSESTRIAVIALWVLFVPGVWFTLQESRVSMVVGITALFAVCLFIFTALIFSVAVLSTMNRKRRAAGDQVSTASKKPSETPVLGDKPYKSHASNFLIDVLVKKD